MKANVLFAALLCLWIVSTAFSQGGNAELGGVVTDPSKALIPGVTVTAKNVDTGDSTRSSRMNREFTAFPFSSQEPMRFPPNCPVSKGHSKSRAAICGAGTSELHPGDRPVQADGRSHSLVRVHLKGILGFGR